LPKKICDSAAPASFWACAKGGLPEFRLADLAVHGDLLAAARDDARLILLRDPELKSPRGEALRALALPFRAR